MLKSLETLPISDQSLCKLGGGLLHQSQTFVGQLIDFSVDEIILTNLCVGDRVFQDIDKIF